MKYSFFAAFFVLFFLIIGGLLTVYGKGTWESIGVNLFTDFFGVAFTIYLLNILIKKREESRTIGARIEAYKKSRRFTAHLLFVSGTFM